MDTAVTEKADPDPPLELSFRLQEDDFIALSNRTRSAWFNLPGWVVYRLSRVVMAAVPIIAVFPLIIARHESWTGVRGIATLGAIVAALVIFSLYPRYLRYRLRRNVAAFNGSGQFDLRLTASDQAIHFERGEDSSTIAWKSIERGEETPAHFFLFLARLRAVAVPKRAFPGESEMNRFRQMTSGRVKDFIVVS